MSNSKERDGYGDALFEEFGAYVDALIEAGERWQEVWNVKAWPLESRLWWLHGRFEVARKFAGIGDVRLTDAQMTQQQEERMAHRELFPNGMPELFPADD
ncbi:hypothetical protein ACWGH2_41830 [Streptomyces sp. NPDC054871]